MTIVYAILALGLLIAFHELGHMLLARLCGIKVHRFSVGFGPALLSFNRGGVDYTIGAIPLGGFVKIQGMTPEEEGVDPADPASFQNKKPWQRLLVLLAGPFFNYALAIVLMLGLYVAGTHVEVPMTIGVVAPGSAAAQAQLLPGDFIASIDGEKVTEWGRLVQIVNDSPERELSLEIVREGKTITIPATPRADANGVGRLGVTRQSVYRKYPFAEALPLSFAFAHKQLADGLDAIKGLVTGRRGVELSSPIGIVKATSDAAASGLDAFLRVLVAISVALAFFNLLPVPALDGGRALFVLAEAATGRKVSPRLETGLHAAGFIFLLALLVYVAVGDVRRLLAPSTHAPVPSSSTGTDAGSAPP